FGLGAVRGEVLTGKPPYTGRDEDQICRKAMAANQADAHARLNACGAEPELVDLCLRCLAPEPDDRPRDAGEVAAAVAEYLATVEQRVHEAEVKQAAAAAEAKEQRKRQRVQACLAATVAVLAVGGGAVGWLQERQAAGRRGPAGGVRPPARGGGGGGPGAGAP